MSSLSVTNKMIENHRIKALDGLRAFAIIFVLFSHSAWKFDSQINISFGGAEFHNFIYNGWVGVDLFFVLSGFLITAQLLKSPLTFDNIRKFFSKRYFRIAPAYYISVFLTLLLLQILPAISEGEAISDLFIEWISPLFSHMVFMHDYIGRDPSINGLFWSIPVEIKFYFLLPLLIYLLLKIRGNAKRIYIIAGFYSLFTIARGVYLYSLYSFDNIKYADYFLDIKTPFHFALDGLAVGVLCAFILRSELLKLISENSRVINSIFYVGVALFLSVSLPPHFIGGTATFFEIAIMTILFAISFGLILIALVKGCCATNFFSNRVLGFIAKISYSMYLTHIYALYFQMMLIDHIKDFVPNPTLCWLVSLPVFFTLAVCFAYLLYIYVEKPFIKWSRNRWS